MYSIHTLQDISHKQIKHWIFLKTMCINKYQITSLLFIKDKNLKLKKIISLLTHTIVKKSTFLGITQLRIVH